MWNADMLANKGKELNQRLMDGDDNGEYGFLKYADGEIRLDFAVAYSVLGVANNVYDLDRRNEFVALLHKTTQVEDAEYKALAVRRWSPVRKAIEVFAEIVADDNTPDLDTLLKQQQIKSRKTSPSWSTLMPDKIYTLAKFWNGINGSINSDTERLQTPFGRAVQEAYSVYSGVQIKSQPTPTHHSYLHNFEIFWARWGKCDVVDINSGLQCYALENNLV